MAASLALGLTACGGPGEETAESTDKLIGAPLDEDHPFDVGLCVGGLVPDGQPNAGSCQRGYCSGTLVAPNLVLTARHCVRTIDYVADYCESTFTDDRIFPEATLVTTSPSSKLGTPKWYSVAAELVPTNGRSLCGHDLVMLVLDRSVPGREARPAKVNTSRNYAARPTQEVAVVGRGAIAFQYDLETFANTVDTGELQRRILEHVPFVCATDDPAQPCVVVDYTSPPTNEFASPPGWFVIGQSVLGGDSGSGVFDQAGFDRRRPKVMGVTSAVGVGADGVPSSGLITRLDTHANFIRDGFRAAARALHRDPDCFRDQME